MNLRRQHTDTQPGQDTARSSVQPGTSAGSGPNASAGDGPDAFAGSGPNAFAGSGPDATRPRAVQEPANACGSGPSATRRTAASVNAPARPGADGGTPAGAVPRKRPASGCDGCPMHNKEGLRRLGINMADTDYVVALAGNPNTGKSTVFNALTGLRQHTGNWPGKTVSRAEGGFSYDENKYKIVDLPGTYSLLATSTDEEVARDFILFGSPDVTVVVTDATRLERNLNLVLQVLEITDRVVVCANLMDEAERNNIKVDERTLARDLGVPVIPTAARNGIGLKELLQAIHGVATGQIATRPHRIELKSRTLKRSLDALVPRIQELYPNLPNARWVALRMLEEDQHIIDSFRSGELGNITNQYEIEDRRMDA